MEEEEIVISSWQQSDFPNDRNGNFSKTVERWSSKENIDMNALMSEQENKMISQIKSEDKEMLLNEEVLSQLIEGDLRTHEEHKSFNRLRKPKPKPRHENQTVGESKTTSSDNETADSLFFGGKEGKTLKSFSDSKENTESLISAGKKSHKNLEYPGTKDKANNLFVGKNNAVNRLFSGGKEKADELFSGQKDSADKLFSGGKEKEKGDDTITSPKPVPHPRSKTKEKHDKNNTSISPQGTNDASKVTVDQLFDSVGKRGKSVSFNNILDSQERDSTSKKSTDILKSPPNVAPRSPKNMQNNSDSVPKSSLEHQKAQRHDGRKVSESNGPIVEHAFRNHRTSNVKELPNKRNSIRDIQHEHNSHIREETASWREGESLQRAHEKYDFHTRNNQGYSSSKYERMHKLESSHQKELGCRRDVTDVLEDHVPSRTGIIPGDDEDRTDQYGKYLPGVENKRTSPMKAHKGLHEMTKSADTYNHDFKYESRDSPQQDAFLRSKGKSLSLTDFSKWENAQFYHDDEDNLDNSRSGFTSSRCIRDAVYREWLQKKQGILKETVRKKVEEKKREKEKIKEKQEKEMLAKKAYDAWNSKKEVVTKTDVKRKKEIKEKELEAKREKILKKQDAKKFFESWKSKKDVVLKTACREKKEKEQEIKRKKIQDHKEKVEIAKKAFDKWKSQKDELLKEEARSNKQAEKLKAKYEKEAEMEKRQECENTFQEFLRKKGTCKRPPPSPTLTQRAWSPGGLTRGTNLIPEKIQPVIPPPVLNRSRSFSGLPRNTTPLKPSKRLSRGW